MRRARSRFQSHATTTASRQPATELPDAHRCIRPLPNSSLCETILMRISRRAWLGLLAVAGLAVGGFLVWCLVPPAPGVTVDNYHRLRPGMTEVEVERILGEPGNDDVLHREFPGEPVKGVKGWYGKGITILVTFDEQGHVTRVYGLGVGPTFLTRVRGWLGL